MNDVIIIGAGHAGVQVADSLRSKGFTGSVTLLDADPALPYQRPPLSKDFVAERDAEALPLRAAKFYAESGITLRTHVRVDGIDRITKVVRLADGTELPYSSLVLATGATSRPLAIDHGHLDGVRVLRSLEDARAMRAGLEDARSVLVVGAGFIGLEFAAAARRRGLEVTVLEAADRPLGRAISAPMADALAEAHRAMGTELMLGEGIGGLVGASGRVTTAVGTSGREYPTDLVVLGIGVLPRDELARDAGLAVGNGIIVDEFLRTSDADIYAVGDCANFPDHGDSARLRLESVQNATDQARHVADSILGRTTPYASLPLFWSNQGAMRLQVAGLAHRCDRTIICGDTAKPRFSVFCFRDDRLVAVESVNHPADHMAARTALANPERPTPEMVMTPGFSLKDHVKRLTAAH